MVHANPQIDTNMPKRFRVRRRREPLPSQYYDLCTVPKLRVRVRDRSTPKSNQVDTATSSSELEVSREIMPEFASRETDLDSPSNPQHLSIMTTSRSLGSGEMTVAQLREKFEQLAGQAYSQLDRTVERGGIHRRNKPIISLPVPIKRSVAGKLAADSYDESSTTTPTPMPTPILTSWVASIRNKSGPPLTTRTSAHLNDQGSLLPGKYTDGRLSENEDSGDLHSSLGKALGNQILPGHENGISAIDFAHVRQGINRGQRQSSIALLEGRSMRSHLRSRERVTSHHKSISQDSVQSLIDLGNYQTEASSSTGPESEGFGAAIVIEEEELLRLPASVYVPPNVADKTRNTCKGPLVMGPARVTEEHGGES